MRSLLSYLSGIFFIRKPPRPADCSKEDKAGVSSQSELEELLARGKAFAVANDHVNALRQFEQAIEINPRSSIVYCHAGVAAFEIGVLDTAQDYFVLALHYDPENEDATLGLAKVSRADLESAFTRLLGMFLSLHSVFTPDTPRDTPRVEKA